MTTAHVIDLSIVLPTYNRLERLQRVLAALEEQDFPRDRFELIVVSDGAEDGTNDFLKNVVTPLQLRPIFQRNQGVAAARNHGVYRARGPIVLFIDDDVVPESCLLTEHWRTHTGHDGDIVLLGPMLTPAGFVMSPWVSWEQAMLLKQYENMLNGRWQPTARQFYTGNTSLAREHIMAAGGFDPAFRRAEDVELAYRLADRGLRFIFNPNAIGYHYAERTFNSWLEIPYAYGRNDVIFTHKKGQQWLLPAIMTEFHTRHALVKALTRAFLGRQRLSTAAITMLRLIAQAGHWLRLHFLPRFAFSGIFNLRHYQGIADELGSRDAFFKAVSEAGQRPPATTLEKAKGATDPVVTPSRSRSQSTHGRRAAGETSEEKEAHDVRAV
jgi:GT2 family glycosyltransferase